MRAKPKTKLSNDLVKWTQQPVVVVLHDGSFYVGWITHLNEETLTLTGQKGLGKIKKAPLHRMEKVKISAFLPGDQTYNAAGAQGWQDPFSFSPIRDGPPVEGGTGFGGFMGFMKQVWPGIQIGLGIVRAVMPLMGRLKL